MSTSLDLDANVRAALKERKGDWQTVAAESKVSYSWISKFMNGHIDNPGFETLKQLYAYLSAPQVSAQPQPTQASEGVSHG